MKNKSLYRNIFFTTKKITYICLVTLILLIFQTIAFSQVKDNSSISNQELEDESNIFTTGPTNCESLLAELDSDLYSKQKLNEDSQVIIIFRMDKNETQKHYNIRKEQLSNWFERRYPRKVIYAKGDIINNDLGRANIYFNGKKVAVIKFSHKRMGVCSGDNPYWILR